jgi:hypothetical protein
MIGAVMKRISMAIVSMGMLSACLTDSSPSGDGDGVVITNGPGPTILAFSATPRAIESGDFVRLEWEAESAESIGIYDGDGNNVYSGTSNIGSHTVSPEKTDTYTLLASNVRGDNRATLSVQVEVHYGAEIVSFVCAPLSAKHGDEMEASWQVKRVTQGLELYANDQLIHLSSAKKGWFQYIPRSTTEFKLIAKSEEGDVEHSETCVIIASPPAIREFYANPSPAPLYGTTELKWEAYGADRIMLERMFPEPRDFPVTDTRNGGLTVSVNYPNSQYKLTVQNDKGETSRLLVVDAGENTQANERIDESEPNNDWPLADDTMLSGAGTETVWGRMYPRGDYDLWRFTVPESTNLLFDAWVYGQAGVLSSCNGDTVMELFDGAGMKVAEDNNGATNVCPAFRQLMLEAGTYYLKLKLRFAGNFDHEYYLDVTLR